MCDLVPVLVSRTLGCVQDFLMQLPVGSCGSFVITVKVTAGSARHGRQCWSSGPSVTLAVGADTMHAILGCTSLPSIMVFTYCRDVITKHEYTLLSVRFLPSILMQHCMLLPFLMASQQG